MTSKNWSGAVRWINLLLPGQKKIYQWRGKCSGQVSKNVSFNSLWPSDANWWQRFGSTLAQVMACCLVAPSHYLNQCWFIISEVQRHGTWKKFRERCPNHQSLKWTWNTNHSSKSLLKSSRGQWVNHCHWEGVAVPLWAWWAALCKGFSMTCGFQKNNWVGCVKFIEIVWLLKQQNMEPETVIPCCYISWLEPKLGIGA